MSFENPRLHIGEAAPEFTAIAVVDGEFADVSLASYKGKYVVLFFYPADFTFVCPTELISYSEKLQDFQKIKCEVLGMSCDTQYSHLAWLNTPRKDGGLGGLVKYPLLADHNASITKQYGCYCFPEGNAYRALYIIDGKGILRHISINDMAVGRNPDETLRLVQAFQYTDENGLVCPAGWKPGDDAMSADPAKSKEYFAKESEASHETSNTAAAPQEPAKPSSLAPDDHVVFRTTEISINPPVSSDNPQPISGGNQQNPSVHSEPSRLSVPPESIPRTSVPAESSPKPSVKKSAIPTEAPPKASVKASAAADIPHKTSMAQETPAPAAQTLRPSAAVESPPRKSSISRTSVRKTEYNEQTDPELADIPPKRQTHVHEEVSPKGLLTTIVETIEERKKTSISGPPLDDAARASLLEISRQSRRSSSAGRSSRAPAAASMSQAHHPATDEEMMEAEPAQSQRSSSAGRGSRVSRVASMQQPRMSAAQMMDVDPANQFSPDMEERPLPHGHEEHVTSAPMSKRRTSVPNRQTTAKTLIPQTSYSQFTLRNATITGDLQRRDLHGAQEDPAVSLNVPAFPRVSRLPSQRSSHAAAQPVARGSRSPSAPRASTRNHFEQPHADEMQGEYLEAPQRQSSANRTSAQRQPSHQEQRASAMPGSLAVPRVGSALPRASSMRSSARAPAFEEMDPEMLDAPASQDGMEQQDDHYSMPDDAHVEEALPPRLTLAMARVSNQRQSHTTERRGHSRAVSKQSSTPQRSSHRIAQDDDSDQAAPPGRSTSPRVSFHDPDVTADFEPEDRNEFSAAQRTSTQRRVSAQEPESPRTSTSTRRSTHVRQSTRTSTSPRMSNNEQGQERMSTSPGILETVTDYVSDIVEEIPNPFGRSSSPGMLQRAGDFVTDMVEEIPNPFGRSSSPGMLQRAGDYVTDIVEEIPSPFGRSSSPGMMERAGDFVTDVVEEIPNPFGRSSSPGMLQRAGDYVTDIVEEVPNPFGRSSSPGMLARAEDFVSDVVEEIPVPSFPSRRSTSPRMSAHEPEQQRRLSSPGMLQRAGDFLTDIADGIPVPSRKSTSPRASSYEEDEPFDTPAATDSRYHLSTSQVPLKSTSFRTTQYGTDPATHGTSVAQRSISPRMSAQPARVSGQHTQMLPEIMRQSNVIQRASGMGHAHVEDQVQPAAGSFRQSRRQSRSPSRMSHAVNPEASTVLETTSQKRKSSAISTEGIPSGDEETVVHKKKTTILNRTSEDALPDVTEMVDIQRKSTIQHPSSNETRVTDIKRTSTIVHRPSNEALNETRTSIPRRMSSQRTSRSDGYLRGSQANSSPARKKTSALVEAPSDASSRMSSSYDSLSSANPSTDNVPAEGNQFDYEADPNNDKGCELSDVPSSGGGWIDQAPEHGRKTTVSTRLSESPGKPRKECNCKKNRKFH